jgi:5-methylcytosine-specific restriction enzyme A
MMAASHVIPEPESLAKALSARFGVELAGQYGHDAGHAFVLVRAADIPAPHGFTIRIVPGWRSLEAAFWPDTYAASLIRAMGEAPEHAKEHFRRVVRAFGNLNNRYSLRINNAVVPDIESLPEVPWRRFELAVVRMTDAMELGANSIAEQAIQVGSACLASVLTLLPLEEDALAAALFESGLPEGAKLRVEVNKYERSPVNRAACIAIYGARCYACGFEFEARYGEIGAGFIEVHHRVPVSTLGAGYVVDPGVDLVPLCSNCHSMVHRKDPPIDVDELRRFLISRQP